MSSIARCGCLAVHEERPLLEGDRPEREHGDEATQGVPVVQRAAERLVQNERLGLRQPGEHLKGRHHGHQRCALLTLPPVTTVTPITTVTPVTTLIATFNI